LSRLGATRSAASGVPRIYSLSIANRMRCDGRLMAKSRPDVLKKFSGSKLSNEVGTLEVADA
jgi:hypothetical protein